MKIRIVLLVCLLFCAEARAGRNTFPQKQLIVVPSPSGPIVVPPKFFITRRTRPLRRRSSQRTVLLSRGSPTTVETLTPCGFCSATTIRRYRLPTSNIQRWWYARELMYFNSGRLVGMVRRQRMKCKHKYREETGIIIRQTQVVDGFEMPYVICKPVYFCLSCRVLFAPRDNEYKRNKDEMAEPIPPPIEEISEVEIGKS